MEEFIFHHLKNRERVCDNNCEPSKPIVEALTNAPTIKSADLFEGAGGLATIPLHKHMDYCCTPFKNRKELFEALDRLRKNNSESTVFEENEIEMILYRMFSSDYSSSFNIDGIATDDFGKQFVIVFFDDNQDTNLPCTNFHTTSFNLHTSCFSFQYSSSVVSLKIDKSFMSEFNMAICLSKSLIWSFLSFLSFEKQFLYFSGSSLLFNIPLESFHKLSVVIVVERQSAVVGLVLVHKVVCLQIRLQVDAQQYVPFHAWPPFCARLGL